MRRCPFLRSKIDVIDIKGQMRAATYKMKERGTVRTSSGYEKGTGKTFPKKSFPRLLLLILYNYSAKNISERAIGWMYSPSL